MPAFTSIHEGGEPKGIIITRPDDFGVVEILENSGILSFIILCSEDDTHTAIHELENVDGVPDDASRQDYEEVCDEDNCVALLEHDQEKDLQLESVTGDIFRMYVHHTQYASPN